ncbi:MAG TPA: tyrosine-type recombinase/integrase [Drouetiella sp.]
MTKNNRQLSKNARPLPPTKPKNADVREREFLTPAEVKALKKAALNATRHGFRDWLLITMIYRHAFRVSELTGLSWSQIDFRKKTLEVKRIKNGDGSVHYLEQDEIDALKRLQEEYPENEFVFCSQRQGPLTPRTVHYIIAKAGELAGLELSVHPHMLRHSKGFQLAKRGEDTRTIQAYLGHKNIQHTAKYTQVDPKKFKGLGKD